MTADHRDPRADRRTGPTVARGSGSASALPRRPGRGRSLIGAGALYAYDQQYVGRVLPGVRVGSVDLSGLDARRRAARASRQRLRLARRWPDRPEPGSRTSRSSPTPRSVAARTSTRCSTEALAVGRGGSPVDRGDRRRADGAARRRRSTQASPSTPTALAAARRPPSPTRLAGRPASTRPSSSPTRTASSVVPGHVGRVADPAPVDPGRCRPALGPARRPGRDRRSTSASASLEPDVTTAEASDGQARRPSAIAAEIVLVVGDEKLPIDGRRAPRLDLVPARRPTAATSRSSTRRR